MKSTDTNSKNTPALVWEPLEAEGGHRDGRQPVQRARVPGGWLVMTSAGGIAFVPDAAVEWSAEVARR